MKKPIIGIVSNFEYIPKGTLQKEVHDVNSDYLNMIINGGGIPLIIPFNNSEKDAQNISNIIDGLLLIGGDDISENCYKNNNATGNLRDIFEIKIYKCCKRQQKPILGICRGLQLINVAEKGTLKNINEKNIKHNIESDGWVNHHEIDIVNNTKLKKIINLDKYFVSSVHHQQIEQLGNNLIVSSKSSDGVIESIESNNENFIFGFQGHIEKCLTNLDKYNDIINKFIMEASNENR